MSTKIRFHDKNTTLLTVPVTTQIRQTMHIHLNNVNSCCIDTHVVMISYLK